MAADRFTQFATSAIKGGSFASQAMDWVVSGLGMATDGANFLKAAFYAINASIAEMVSFFLSGIDKMLAGVDWLVEKVTGTKTSLGGTLKDWSTAFETVAIQELGKAEKAWSNIGKGKVTVRNLVDDIQAGAGTCRNSSQEVGRFPGSKRSARAGTGQQVLGGDGARI